MKYRIMIVGFYSVSNIIIKVLVFATGSTFKTNLCNIMSNLTVIVMKTRPSGEKVTFTKQISRIEI